MGIVHGEEGIGAYGSNHMGDKVYS